MASRVEAMRTTARRRRGVRAALMLSLGALWLGGCASPLAVERDAGERWRELDEGTYRTSAWSARPSQPAASASPTAGALPDDPTLDDYLRYAVEHNPGLQAAFHQWRGTLERVPQARALADPQLSYSYFVRESMTQQTVSLSQMFPWYGKLRARGDTAMQEALAAEQRFEAQVHAVRAGVKQAYAEYVYLARALAVLRENHRILQDLEAGAGARFEAGATPYADVARAGVAVEQALDEIRSLEERRGSLMGPLNAALGRPADAPAPWPQTLPAPELAIDEPQLLAELVRRNPELQALRHETTGRRHAHRLTRQNWIPDLMLGVEYMDMVTMDDQVAVMASINVPIWAGRLGAERAEALASFGAATRRQVDRRHELQSELRLAWYRFHDADRRASLFERTLIPMTRDAMDATEAAYGEGQAEFQALTQAQSALQTLQLTYERTVIDRFQALADLERLVGRDLSHAERTDASPDEADAAPPPKE